MYPIEAGTFIDPQTNGTIVIGKGVADFWEPTSETTSRY